MSRLADLPDGVADAHPDLARAVDHLGEDARRWLGDLPRLVAETAGAWELTVHGALAAQGETSRVLDVTTGDGTAAVLKLLVPHEGARGESDALSAWAGDGAVRLLRRSDDGLTLLLERLHPGDDLWSLPRHERFAVTTSLLPRLWDADSGRLPARVPRLADTVARWLEGVEQRVAELGQPDDVVADVERWAGDLLASMPAPRLLHGDLHPGNVLRDADRGWVAIDPKPWVGDPAFDLVQLVWNEVDDDGGQAAADELRGWVGQLAAAVGLDTWRVLRWTVVKMIGWPVPPTRAAIAVCAARDHERDAS